MVVIFLIGFPMNSNDYNNGLVYSIFGNTVQETPEQEDYNPEGFGPVYESSPSFIVEPVRAWEQPNDFIWDNPTPSNYVTINTPGAGRVYSTKEKEQFRDDLFTAYSDALMKRGIPEEAASEYAKRLVAQDALESRYGQSQLSKWFNFGGIKDFRAASDSLKVSTKEHDNGRYTTKVQPFRKFKNLDEYVNYKIDLLGNENYNVFAYTPEMLYRRLTSAKKKYATDPDYERKLNNVYYLLWRR